MIKIMADNWQLGIMWVLMGHFIDIPAGTMLKTNPLFSEITVYLKNKNKERYTFELVSESKEKYPPNITRFFLIIFNIKIAIVGKHLFFLNTKFKCSLY